MVSTSLTTGAAGNGRSAVASVSSDGRYVAFTSSANNLVPDAISPCPRDGLDQFPACTSVFLRDLHSKKTELISVDRNGNSLDGQSSINNGNVISADGRYVVYASEASGITPTTDNTMRAPEDTGLYVRDRKDRRTERVSVDSTGRTIMNYGGMISSNGRQIAFWANSGSSSACSILQEADACDDANHRIPFGLFLFDRDTGQLSNATAPGKDADPNFNGGLPSAYEFDDSLRYGAFDWHDDIDPSDANKGVDVFLQDLGTIGQAQEKSPPVGTSPGAGLGAAAY